MGMLRTCRDPLAAGSTSRSCVGLGARSAVEVGCTLPHGTSMVSCDWPYEAYSSLLQPSLTTDLHDLFMILYLVLNLPWMVLSTMHSTTAEARRWR